MTVESTQPSLVTAAVLVIGNEILSGRTQDTNLAYLARKLNEYGIQIYQARVVPDVERDIVEAVNALRVRYDYVFTTGGIGPTHDDITADCIAAAFGVDLVVSRGDRRHHRATAGAARDHGSHACAWPAFHAVVA